ncbi:MAG TPA: response regulator, partial [Candidatus Paceibacterota bacterium]|nr:response regulator [Candidatus Paceibacterota bacterium]
MITPKKIRVLVVDDSAVVRRAISDALSKDPQIEVVGSACDPYVARDKILELNPDVLTLDIEMPRMDGLTFLRILQQHRPMPVVVISSLTQAGSKAALSALEAGAVDVLAKPNSSWSIGDLSEQLAHRVKGAAIAKMGGPVKDVAGAPVVAGGAAIS